MGTWGTAIFSDDTAVDIRDEFLGLLGDGMTVKQATAELLARWAGSLADVEEGPVVWLALAATQHKLGLLLPDVKARALEIIDSGSDLKRWSDVSTARAREKALNQLKARFEGPQPAPKAVKKRPRTVMTWQPGEWLAYRLRSGKHALFHVVSLSGDRGGDYASCRVLAWNHAHLPDQSDALALEDMPDDTPGLRKSSRGALVLGERGFPAGRLSRLSFQSDVPAPCLLRKVGFLPRHADRLFEQVWGLT